MKLVGLLLYGTVVWGASLEVYFTEAGRAFGIEPALLKRIATIESGMNPRAINRNTNGTVDLGLMQINTIHLRRLSKVGVTREALMDPEVNIYVAALLLSSHIRKNGYNLSAIGNYHSANPLYKSRWLKRLAMAQLPQGGTAAADSGTAADDPRSRFAQQQLAQRTDAKIAAGMDPKAAWREAKAEVDRLMGYSGGS